MCRIFLFEFLLLISISVHGQGEFGLKLGTNLSRVEGEFDYYKTENQLGMQVAFVFSYSLSETVILRTEAAFVQKGGRIDYTLEDYDAQWKLEGVQRINYLEVPLNVDLKLSTNQQKFFFVSVGFYGAVAIGGKLDLENDFTDIDEPINSKVIHYSMPMEFKDVVTDKDQSDLGSFEEEYGFVKKYDCGPKFGFGYRHKNMLMDFSYSVGLMNINPHEEGVTSNEIKKSNRNIQFSFTYFISN